MEDNTNIMLIMNEFNKIHDEISELTETLHEMQQQFSLLVAYVKDDKSDDATTKSLINKSLINYLPDDNYLDELEKEELKKAKEDLDSALDKFNCTYPEGV